MDHLLVRAKVSIILTVTGLMTGEKVSLKSNPGNWWNPFATSQALNLFMDPFGFSLIRKTHLHPIALRLGGRGTRVHVLLFWRAWNSALIASSQSGWDKACWTDVASVWARKTLGFKEPVLERVIMECVFAGGRVVELGREGADWIGVGEGGVGLEGGSKECWEEEGIEVMFELEARSDDVIGAKARGIVEGKVEEVL